MRPGYRHWMFLALVVLTVLCLVGCGGMGQTDDDSSSSEDSSSSDETVPEPVPDPDPDPAVVTTPLGGVEPPTSPILVIAPGASTPWGVRDPMSGSLVGANFGGVKAQARFFGDAMLWGKDGDNWFRASTMKIALQDGTVLTVSDSGGSLVTWKEGTTVPPVCAYNCQSDFPAKWGGTNAVVDIKASGRDFGSETTVTQMAQDPGN